MGSVWEAPGGEVHFSPRESYETDVSIFLLLIELKPRERTDLPRVTQSSSSAFHQLAAPVCESKGQNRLLDPPQDLSQAWPGVRDTWLGSP